MPILQCSLAAAVSWLVAIEVFGHVQPFFAPIAAVVSLGVSLGHRLRRSVELVVGVTVGIGVADVLISSIGTGVWQIALVVALAMSTAILVDGGPIISIQAASSAVLVATLLPPGGSAGLSRMVDALIGGLVGIVVVAVVPTHPVRRARRDAAAVLAIASSVLRDVAEGLRTFDPDLIKVALVRVRASQDSIDTMRADLAGGREISRISPLYWNSRDRLRRLDETADPIDNAIRNIRVLTRRALTLIRDGQRPDAGLVELIAQLSKAIEVVRRMVLADPGDQPDQAAAARVLRSVAVKTKPDLVAGGTLSESVVLAQLRSLVVDLLQVSGLNRISALATLPPTVAHPAVSPEERESRDGPDPSSDV